MLTKSVGGGREKNNNKTDCVTVANLILISKLPKFNVLLVCRETNVQPDRLAVAKS